MVSQEGVDLKDRVSCDVITVLFTRTVMTLPTFKLIVRKKFRKVLGLTKSISGMDETIVFM